MWIQVGRVPWYRREDWDELKRMSVDRAFLPQSYDQWLARAENGVRHIGDRGHVLEKVYVDPRELAAWCASRGLDVDGEARMRFANEAAAVGGAQAG